MAQATVDRRFSTSSSDGRAMNSFATRAKYTHEVSACSTCLSKSEDRYHVFVLGPVTVAPKKRSSSSEPCRRSRLAGSRTLKCHGTVLHRPGILAHSQRKLANFTRRATNGPSLFRNLRYTCWEEPFHGRSVGQCLLCLRRLRVRLSIGVRRSINAEIAIRMLGNGSVQNRSALYMLKRSSIMIHDYA
jgi:hypothetical protein